VHVLTPSLGLARATTYSVALYAVHNVLYAIFSYGGGWLADFINKRIMLVAGYSLAALAVFAMAIGIHGLAGLAVMFAVAGMAVGTYEAVEDALAADLLHRQVRGSGYGVLAMVTGLGDMLSSVIVGWLWAVFGGGIAFSLAGICMLAGIVLLLVFHTRGNGETEILNPA